jgi:hypothetical protein
LPAGSGGIRAASSGGSVAAASAPFSIADTASLQVKQAHAEPGETHWIRLKLSEDHPRRREQPRMTNSK